MTLNARFILKCAQWTARLTYTFVAGFGFDHTHRCSQRGEGGVGWRAQPPPCRQLTRCFSAAAELLVSIWGCSRCTTSPMLDVNERITIVTQVLFIYQLSSPICNIGTGALSIPNSWPTALSVTKRYYIKDYLLQQRTARCYAFDLLMPRFVVRCMCCRELQGAPKK